MLNLSGRENEVLHIVHTLEENFLTPFPRRKSLLYQVSLDSLRTHYIYDKIVFSVFIFFLKKAIPFYQLAGFSPVFFESFFLVFTSGNKTAPHSQVGILYIITHRWSLSHPAPDSRQSLGSALASVSGSWKRNQRNLCLRINAQTSLSL